MEPLQGNYSEVLPTPAWLNRAEYAAADE